MRPSNLNNERMRELHNELTEMFDGLSLEIVLFSCATLMAHAYVQLAPEKRQLIREKVNNFISHTIRDLDTCGQKPN